jgi:hypothetical protein
MFGFKRAKTQLFTDMLDRISPAAPEPDAEAPIEPVTATPSQAGQPQDWLLQLLSGMVPAESFNTEAQAARQVFEASYLEDEVSPLLEAIANCEQDAIAEELGLSENLSKNDLHKLRREFARANHPDRLDPSQRDLATHRMTIANMLIDRELQQRSPAR